MIGGLLDNSLEPGLGTACRIADAFRRLCRVPQPLMPSPETRARRAHCIEEFLIFNPRMYHWSGRLLCEREQVSGRAVLLEGS